MLEFRNLLMLALAVSAIGAIGGNGEDRRTMIKLFGLAGALFLLILIVERMCASVQKTNIEWCDATWNPVTGCKRGCEYCYARRIAGRFGGWTTNGVKTTLNFMGDLPVLDSPLPLQRKDGKVVNAPFPFGFEPTLHRYRLDELHQDKKPKNVFVCSMSDLFGPWVPEAWIADVLKACLLSPQHRYLFLTKYPERYLELYETGLLPCRDNFWYGSTATHPETDQMMYSEHLNTFVSIEPLSGPFGTQVSGALEYIDWFIIGAETGNRKGKVVPEKSWVKEIVDYCDSAGKPVFMKDSLIPVVNESIWRREFPWDS